MRDEAMQISNISIRDNPGNLVKVNGAVPVARRTRCRFIGSQLREYP